jgi:Zn finger protein HypA/HybF involved in hydrogenase expression
MPMDDGEKIIKKTSEEWSVILKGSIRSTHPITWDELEDHPEKTGSMILTENRIIIGDYSISLDDIVEIDLKPQFADIPKIRITCNDRIENLQFHRGSLSHGINILWGEIDFAYAEDQAYTAYWASLLTMAAFLYGKNYGKIKEVIKEVKHEDRKIWCPNCKKYIDVLWTDELFDVVTCPECGHNGMMSHNPEEKWCPNCKKYVSVPWTDVPVWQIICPECGCKGMMTQSPEDRKRSLD